MPMYKKPGEFTAKVMNGGIRLLIERFGMSPGGAQSLSVRGRKTGTVHTVPVNPLTMDGKRYLVAPRGDTQWARNLRAAGEGELRLGGKTERFTATEISDDQKVPILRAYIHRWARTTSALFGVSKDASDADLTRIAPDHPIFQITPR